MGLSGIRFTRWKKSVIYIFQFNQINLVITDARSGIEPVLFLTFEKPPLNRMILVPPQRPLCLPRPSALIEGERKKKPLWFWVLVSHRASCWPGCAHPSLFWGRIVISLFTIWLVTFSPIELWLRDFCCTQIKVSVCHMLACKTLVSAQLKQIFLSVCKICHFYIATHLHISPTFMSTF